MGIASNGIGHATSPERRAAVDDGLNNPVLTTVPRVSGRFLRVRPFRCLQTGACSTCGTREATDLTAVPTGRSRHLAGWLGLDEDSADNPVLDVGPPGPLGTTCIADRRSVTSTAAPTRCGTRGARFHRVLCVRSATPSPRMDWPGTRTPDPVLVPGNEGTGNEVVGNPSVVRDGSTYHMLFAGGSTAHDSTSGMPIRATGSTGRRIAATR